MALTLSDLEERFKNKYPNETASLHLSQWSDVIDGENRKENIVHFNNCFKRFSIPQKIEFITQAWELDSESLEILSRLSDSDFSKASLVQPNGEIVGFIHTNNLFLSYSKEEVNIKHYLLIEMFIQHFNNIEFFTETLADNDEERDIHISDPCISPFSILCMPMLAIFKVNPCQYRHIFDAINMSFPEGFLYKEIDKYMGNINNINFLCHLIGAIEKQPEEQQHLLNQFSKDLKEGNLDENTTVCFLSNILNRDLKYIDKKCQLHDFKTTNKDDNIVKNSKAILYLHKANGLYSALEPLTHTYKELGITEKQILHSHFEYGQENHLISIRSYLRPRIQIRSAIR
jgi:hypothetical protein